MQNQYKTAIHYQMNNRLYGFSENYDFEAYNLLCIR